MLIDDQYRAGEFTAQGSDHRFADRVSQPPHCLHSGGDRADRGVDHRPGEVSGLPGTLDVAYPGRLSRGLVLVKWWLLAIPQYAIVAVFAGGAAYTATGGSGKAWRPMPSRAA